MSINVLLVDDSALVRKVVKDIIERDPAIKVVGVANNGSSAVFKNSELNPDVIVLDIEMPLLNGISCLMAIMEADPKPVIMLSGLSNSGEDIALKCLELGAIDFVVKPMAIDLLEQMSEELVSKIKLAAEIKVQPVHSLAGLAANTDFSIRDHEKGTKRIAERIVAIGVSTGGPPALVEVFQRFPKNFPAAVLVAQHMPRGFTHSLAERLNGISTLNVKEAASGDVPFAGCAYIAPGDKHLMLRVESSGYVLRVEKTDKVNGCRPSADVLFKSVSEAAGKDAIGVIMTGMGSDGADGIKRIRNSGGHTIAQDRVSSVIYGMNRAAIEMDAIDEIVRLDEITKKIVEYIDIVNDYRNRSIVGGR